LKILRISMSLLVSGLLFSTYGSAQAANNNLKHGNYLRPAEVPYPAYNKPNAARIELGKKLFFDTRLSGSNNMSCASCHNPAKGWSDGLPTAIGNGGKVLGRASPTVLNTAYNAVQMWDGRARTLEDQATGPIVSKDEMNQDMGKLIKELKAVKQYVKMFEKAYPGEGISKPTIAKAIASYERTIVSQTSPFDKWVKGNKKAISASAQRGFKLFEGKANCIACHMDWNFADDGFHNIGLAKQDDSGRFAHIPVKVLRGAFKTPTLRNITLTAPYFHDGSASTLMEVMKHYNKGGVDLGKGLDPNMKPLHLSKKEMQDVVEFMKTLTDIKPVVVK